MKQNQAEMSLYCRGNLYSAWGTNRFSNKPIPMFNHPLCEEMHPKLHFKLLLFQL